MTTQTNTHAPLKIKKLPRQRHFLAVFFISFVWGVFGVDRMYLGKWGTGFLKLITAGGVGVWLIIDLWLIMNGTMRDAQGREMAGFAEYKSLAYKTTLIFALVVAVMTLVGGLFLVQAVINLISELQNGTLPGFEVIDLNSPTFTGL